MPLKPLSPGQSIPDVGSFDVLGPMGFAPAMISIYKDVASRVQGTEEFLNTVRAMNIPKLTAGAEWFVQNYPRVAAHMRLKPDLAKGTFGAATHPPIGTVTKPIPMSISHVGADLIDASPPIAKEYLAHEGTHVAQALGNSRFGELYTAAQQIAPYSENPFEMSAKNAGLAAKWGLEKSNMHLPAIQGLDQLSQISNHPAAKFIQDILALRKK